MKLGTKLYLFFAGIVILPLLVVTVVSSLLLARSGRETYQTRMQSGLVAATAILSEQDRALAGDLESSLKQTDYSALASGDSSARGKILDPVRSRTGADQVILSGGSGQSLASSGQAAGDHPLLQASVDLTGNGGSPLRVTALKNINSAAIADAFSLQDLDWAILDGDKAVAGSLAGDVRNASGGAVAAAPAGAGGPAFPATAGGTDVTALATSLPAAMTSKPLVLVASVPSSVAGAASRRALEAGLVLTFMTLALAVILGYMLSRTITGPLRRLNEAAAAGAAGDLGREVEIHSRDEIGNLAASFNLMQSNIRSYVKELEESRSNMLLALSYAGDVLGATSDRARLIKTTAEAARLATGARAVWVALNAGGGAAGHKAVSVGVPFDYFQDQERKREIDEYAGAVGAGRRAPGEIVALAGGVAIGYPLRHGGESLGSLLALFGDSRALEGQSKRSILDSLATQAASAVDNVNFAELQRMLAVTDPMTGVANFRSLQEKLSDEINKSRRYRHPLSLAILDLDDFKRVNDTFGHQTGDELLREVAQLLSRRVRDVDIVARYGGEEFAVVFPETPKEAVISVADGLRQSIQDVRISGDPGVRVTASIGVAAFPGDAADERELVEKADAALYRAKESGKNRVAS